MLERQDSFIARDNALRSPCRHLIICVTRSEERTFPFPFAVLCVVQSSPVLIQGTDAITSHPMHCDLCCNVFSVSVHCCLDAMCVCVMSLSPSLSLSLPCCVLC